MSLASRLSASFLTALAVVLVGFSASLYTLASHHLHRLLDERLDSALTTLAAAAEVSPQGVEWEPDERVLVLGRDQGADQVRWVVRDVYGRVVDRSANLNPRRLSPEQPQNPATGRFAGLDGRAWRVKSRRLTVPSAKRVAGQGDDGRSELGVGEQTGVWHAALILVVYAPLGPTEATLRHLGLTVFLLSTALWLAAAVAGRRLCRRALVPLTRMAMAARVADAEEPWERLPVPGTRDELEDLGHAFNGLLERQHETLDRLYEALEQQRRFTGDASHQLRTPLAGLLSQVDVALRRDRPPEEYRRVLGVVRKRAAHLQQIVESLLFLARPDAEAGRPEPEVIDLATWVHDHLQGWSGHARASDLQTDDSSAGPLWVSVHPPLLAQAVDNLLDNACKYSSPGTPISVRTGRQRNEISLAVEDRGEGLSAEELAQIFEPFYRAPGARRRGQSGFGLGLAVARRIVTAFGGTVTAHGESGRGSCFTICLPASPGLPAASASTGIPLGRVLP